MSPVHEQRPPQDLGELGAGRPGEERVGGPEPVLRRLGPRLHLDELVIEERPVELAEQRLGHPLLADLDHRRKVVAGCSKGAAQR
jgi:hypothetical protein